MKDIIVPKPQTDTLAGQMVSLYETLKGFSSSEDISFDLSQLDFARPFLTLPISAYINTTGSIFTNKNSSIDSYLGAVKFPKGIDSISSFMKNSQVKKSYIPISVLTRDKAADRDRLESLFSAMVCKVMGNISGANNAVYYPISELITNIFEHSKEDKGFIFGQFYPKDDCLEICIVDRGIGLAATYMKEKGIKLSDTDAITEVMRGHSTKPDKERGYGVRTSKRVVCEALGGEFAMISNSGALLSSKGKEILMPLPNFDWQGVIVAYRIPRPDGPIDISPYLE
jgi:hypothetical protein